MENEKRIYAPGNRCCLPVANRSMPAVCCWLDGFVFPRRSLTWIIDSSFSSHLHKHPISCHVFIALKEISASLFFPPPYM